MRFPRYGALVLALATLTVACTTKDTSMESLPDDAVITYAYHDSSVPPQYHRSLTLTVTREESRIVVDSYGTVLADETSATPPDVWATLAKNLPSISRLSLESAAEGCVGGTAFDLTIESQGERQVDISADACSGTNVDAEVAVLAWVAPARELFPSMSDLAPEG